MSLADAVRAFAQNLLGEKGEVMCMWEAMVIRAERYDWREFSRQHPSHSKANHALWLACWQQMPLFDIHHFPLWERGVHNLLQAHFVELTRIFSHYTKGISGIDSAADALEMELEEFHDFIKV